MKAKTFHEIVRQAAGDNKTAERIFAALKYNLVRYHSGSGSPAIIYNPRIRRFEMRSLPTDRIFDIMDKIDSLMEVIQKSTIDSREQKIRLKRA